MAEKDEFGGAAAEQHRHAVCQLLLGHQDNFDPVMLRSNNSEQRPLLQNASSAMSALPYSMLVSAAQPL
jgi:hypothetical protein